MAARWGKFQMAGLGALRRLLSCTGSRTYPLGPRASPTGSYDKCEQLKSYRRHMGSSVYFTAIKGSTNVEYSTAVTLKESFDKHRSRHYDSTINLTTNTTVSSFSKLSQDIFRQIARIAFEKAINENKYFCFDASKILLKQEGCHTIVFVPEEQICDKKQTLYVDKVVGPVAELMYNVFTGHPLSQYTPYKEILDLMHLSQSTPKWWKTLDDILSHPIYWSNEQRLAALASATN